MPLPERRHLPCCAVAAVVALASGTVSGMAWAAQPTPSPAPMQASTMAVAPLYVGPAWGEGNPQADTGTLHVRLDNAGVVADRLVRVNCAPAGQAALLNGIVRQVDGVQQNGLDIPGRPEGSDVSVPIEASISLTGTQPKLTPGTTVSCALGFLNAGERLVVFTIGAPRDVVTEP